MRFHDDHRVVCRFAISSIGDTRQFIATNLLFENVSWAVENNDNLCGVDLGFVVASFEHSRFIEGGARCSLRFREIPASKTDHNGVRNLQLRSVDFRNCGGLSIESANPSHSSLKHLHFKVSFRFEIHLLFVFSISFV